MLLRRAWLPVFLPLFASTGLAAELGVVTLADGAPLVLRGDTWFRVVPGARVEDGDIVGIPARGQVQAELPNGGIVNGTGPVTLYFPATTRTGPIVVELAAGWVKAAASAPGLRVRTVSFDVVVPEGALVLHAAPAGAEVFVESGAARIVDTSAASDRNGREAKRGEYWTRGPAGALQNAGRPPKAFVEAMPAAYRDALPVLAAKSRARPELVADHPVTFDEARPWLDGPERATFEKRFAGRLRDPAFRKAVEPDVARYPAWDRQLHPEKFKPKEASP